MRNLTQRQIKIMRYMITQDNYMSLETVSSNVDTSKRTLRRDIQEINSKLLPEGISIVSKTGRGITVTFKDADAEITSRKVFVNDANTFNNNVRLLKIASDLLMNSPQRTSISELAEKYFISRASIVNDLKKIELWLSDFNLILAKDLSGTRIEGSDKNMRVAMKSLVLKSIYSNQNTMEIRIDDSILLELSVKFGDRHVAFATDLITYIEEQLNYSISDPYYINLFTHILVLIHRINTKVHNSRSVDSTFKANDQKTYTISLTAIQKIEESYQVKLSALEVEYIYQYIISSGKTELDSSIKVKSDESQRASAFTQLLITRVSALIKVDITDDENLMASLLSHVKPMLNRLEYHIRIKNPLLHDIKTELGTVFSAIKTTVNSITQEYQLDSVNDDEVGYLTVHIQAAIEKKFKKIRVLLVCSSGLGTSQLLYGRVMRAFPEWDVVDIVPGKEIAEYIKHKDINIIISTIKIAEVSKPVVYVSALFSARDITRVTECLVSNYMK